MKKLILLPLVGMLLFMPLAFFGQTLHLIAVQDDTDSRLGTAIDIKHMKSFVEKVAEETSMELNSHFYTKSELKSNPTALGKKIQSLNVSSDDAVIFYYTGHGFNPEGSNYTAFQVRGNTNVHYTTDDVHSELKAKNPRLLITMYDACNHHNRHEYPLLATLSDEQVALQKLFLLSRGDIKIASNTKGNAKWSYTSPELGGVFSNAFFASINTVIKYENYNNITWEEILSKTKTKVKEETKNEERGQQIPYYSKDNIVYVPRREIHTEEEEEPQSEDWRNKD